MADMAAAPRERIAEFKLLAVEAAKRVAAGRAGYGVLLDSEHGRKALFRAEHERLWIGRPVEKPGSRPLDLDGMADLGSHLAEWPATHTVKCLCFYHPDDDAALKAEQERELLRVADAARTVGRELMLEIIAGRHGVLGEGTVAAVLERLYDLGIRPDWWKLEAQPSPAAWQRIEAVIAARDPFCRGVVVLGLDAPQDELAATLRAAAASPIVKGFAVGRTIFGSAARQWLAGEIDDETAVADMAARFAALAEAWEAGKAEAVARQPAEEIAQ
jgi:5-dehydro-2-deoxygluconokinase